MNGKKHFIPEPQTDLALKEKDLEMVVSCILHYPIRALTESNFILLVPILLML